MKKWIISFVLAFITMTIIIVLTEFFEWSFRNIIIALIGIPFLALCFRLVIATTPAAMKELKEREDRNIAAKRDDGIPKCPRCRSTSISANQKGFGIGKAVVGAAIAGPLGLVGGNIGAKKVRITCLNCGHQWMAGKN
ncbi:MAG: hypothetical protein ACOYJD_07075 [Christensenellales bacterium]